MTRLTDKDALYIELVKMKDFGELTAKKAIRIVANAPTIEAEPVQHGKWVPKTIIIGGRDHVSGMKCSVCGEDPLNAEGDEFLTDYCPNCGARMDAERKEE